MFAIRVCEPEAWADQVERYAKHLESRQVHLDYYWRPDPLNSVVELCISGVAFFTHKAVYFLEFVGEAGAYDGEKQAKLKSRAQETVLAIKVSLEQSGLDVLPGWLEITRR